MTQLARPIARSWLTIANVLVALFVALPIAAPLLLAHGQTNAAEGIYALYSAVCHQWAFRSYFILGSAHVHGLPELLAVLPDRQVYATLGDAELGYKVAFCQRDLAIYLTVLLAGLGYAAWRARMAPLGVPAYLALIAPMALDGFTQLFGWRESTVELRTVTGALFGLASVWLLYPRIDRVLSPVDAAPSKPIASPLRASVGSAAPTPG